MIILWLHQRLINKAFQCTQFLNTSPLTLASEQRSRQRWGTTTSHLKKVILLDKNFLQTQFSECIFHKCEIMRLHSRSAHMFLGCRQQNIYVKTSGLGCVVHTGLVTWSITYYQLGPFLIDHLKRVFQRYQGGEYGRKEGLLHLQNLSKNERSILI